MVNERLEGKPDRLITLAELQEQIAEVAKGPRLGFRCQHRVVRDDSTKRLYLL
jgi:hypothetical protein